MAFVKRHPRRHVPGSRQLGLEERWASLGGVTALGEGMAPPALACGLDQEQEI